MSLVLAAVVTLAVVAAMASPHLLGSQVESALDGLRHAQPAWLWLAGLGSFCSLIAAAGAWRSVLAACGARLSLRESCARYGMGSLANTVLPYQLGDVIRVGLFARAVGGGRERLWSVSGGLVAIGAARALCLAVLASVSWAMGGTPLWPALALGGVVVGVSTVMVAVRGRTARSRAGHLLDALRGLGRSPSQGLRVCGWVGLATASRLLAAAAVSAALGVPQPLVAALLIVVALDLSGQFPLTPGNIGVANGAVALALASHGIGLPVALSVSLASQGVETAAGIVFGAAGALRLAPAHTILGHPRTAQLAAGLAAMALTAGLGLSILRV